VIDEVRRNPPRGAGRHALRSGLRLANTATCLTGIPHTITVTISLVGVRHQRTVVADITNAIMIAIGLIRIERGRTVVRAVGNAIAISIESRKERNAI